MKNIIFTKNNAITSNIFKTFLFAIVAFTFLAFNTKQSHAQSRELAEICAPDKGVFNRIAKALEEVNIRRTMSSGLASMLLDGSVMFATGGDMGQIMKCTHVLNNDVPGTNLDMSGTPECVPDPDDIIFCQNLFNSYQSDQLDLKDSISYNQTGGSLAAINKSIHNTIQEPIPVNLAYYMERQTEDIPYMGTAFAQFTGSSAATYSGPMLDITFTIWKITRNAAYAFIAIVMIIVGVLIMTRKRINSQTAVTVQYALPRLIIALVLITFSYPIGASIASIGWALKGSASSIVYSLGGLSANDAFGLTSLGLVPILILFLAAVIIGTGGAGLAVLMIGAVALLVALVVYLIVQIKMVIVYFRIVLKTITAPLTFVQGAVPGNENKTTDWFKESLILMFSLLGMQAGITITHVVVSTIVLQLVGGTIASVQSADVVDALGGLAGALILGPIMVPFILAFGYYQSWQIPKNLEKAFMGEKRR